MNNKNKESRRKKDKKRDGTPRIEESNLTILIIKGGKMVTGKATEGKWREIAILDKCLKEIGRDQKIDKWKADEIVLFCCKIRSICAALQQIEEELAAAEHSPREMMHHDAVMLIIQFNAIPASIWRELPLTQQTAQIYEDYMNPIWASGVSGIRGFLIRQSEAIGIKSYGGFGTKFPSTIGIEY